ncbi:MAG: hypothetical protein M1814_001419 [Vezdaea aestivalis]|nr:MAG: hypothetical protein M1814_001419 [Vezdaea aestivalis]
MSDFRAVIDMGSNGIRFSITNLQGSAARILPTIFQDRASISLYNAQWATGQKQPIPQTVIDDVITHFLRFKANCSTFGANHIDVLATEATRTAVNSEDFRAQIKSKTGLSIRLLSKSEESNFGAYGIASSVHGLSGLAMDLGGGSTQMSWVSSKNGQLEFAQDGLVSLPYGAAALMQRLLEAGSDPQKQKALFSEMVTSFKAAYTKASPPDPPSKPVTMYLSGGGWRRAGHVFMARYGPLYPIPLINGFHVTGTEFSSFADTKATILSTTSQIFGVSRSKFSQLPAIEWLIKVLTAALPPLGTVYFLQGGTREGYLYASLPPSIRALDPLTVATDPYAPPHTPPNPHPTALLSSSLPNPLPLASLLPDILPALTNLHLHHLPVLPDNRPSAALYCTTSGLLASTHGLDHTRRAFLALALCERWGGKVPPVDRAFKDALQNWLGDEKVFWAKYLGKVLAILGAIWPAGEYEGELVGFRGRWEAGGEGRRAGLDVRFKRDVRTEEALLADLLEDIGKVKFGGKGQKKVDGMTIRVTPKWE